ncbi:helix-turn-helix transcriptional regulator [Telmatospirillum sp.]|uniref:helix-turn-helix domain-containing protein n=1 Tax=Telmatospirillum sp. TaxID=2079197 RepID=UPI00284CF7AA|nr:helix-turn-helix transcriptional regulator [Telmatospirillum sp.]MDR3437505.1 helix-turn-helix transcriptional regulator [Telmatospirillum sp.]
MQGLGERLRQRARELGLTDTEVARRLGLSQARYANYVNDKREPDFRTFIDICRILSTSPDRLFGLSDAGFSPGFGDPAHPFDFDGIPIPADETAILRDRIQAATEAMTIPTLKTAVAVMDALVRVQSEDS